MIKKTKKFADGIRNKGIVFGLSETGLAIGRSLSQNGINVIGISYVKEIGYHSKHIKGYILPHPVLDDETFKNELSKLCNAQQEKPVLFIASDEYLQFYIKNEKFIKDHFLYTISPSGLIAAIQDKYLQYQLAVKAKIDVPKTFFFQPSDNIYHIINSIQYPVFIKARDVNTWRKKVSGHMKGYVINNPDELFAKLTKFNTFHVPVIIQEIIQSPDNQNSKACVFIDRKGEIRLLFTMKKIHQYPIHFGIASSAISVKNDHLEEIGQKLFTSIGYRGVGSAEFKMDERDGKLKLIEINSRYWQQNALANLCGMNFPLMDYLVSTGQEPESIKSFTEGLKYVNLNLCWRSYWAYHKEGSLTFSQWMKDLYGKKTISFLSNDDLRLTVIYWYRQFMRFLIRAMKKRKDKLWK